MPQGRALALGSTSSAENAGAAGTSGIAPLPAPPTLPTDDAAADEYGMGAELGAGTALGALAGPAAEAPDLACAGAALPSGGMALLLTGAGRDVLPTPLGAGDVAGCGAAFETLTLRFAWRTGGFLSA